MKLIKADWQGIAIDLQENQEMYRASVKQMIHKAMNKEPKEMQI